MGDEPRVIWEQEGYVATVTLSQPAKKNAISWKMWSQLREAFERVATDPDVRCVVVTGAGGDFSTGADLSDAENLASSAFDVRDRMQVVNAAARAFFNCSVPTIAKVEGVAAGAMCNLALGCDLVVASTEARFSEIFVKRGLTVDFGGSAVLTRALPMHKAKEFALFGEVISAEAAHELGLVNRLYSTDEIDAVVKDLAERVAAMPPRAVATIKENLNRAPSRTLDEVLDAEAEGQAMLYTSEDTREAVLAFIEKREPRFTGR